MAEADVKRITSRINDRVRRRTSGSRAGDAGLIRTNALVELLGGRLSLASRLNEGTIVEVRLPLGAIRVEPAPVRELTARPRV
jgi:signal transduction histidine kinase